MWKRKYTLLAALVGALLLLSALPALAQSYLSYVVQHGDTLSRIARRFCTTANELYALNAHIIGPNPKLLFAGATITVVNRCGVSGVFDRGVRPRATGYVVGNLYVVAQGDWLNAIAARFGVTTHAIVQANGLANANRIFAGQGLRIPGLGGVHVPPAPPPYYPPPTPLPPQPAVCSLTALTGLALYQSPAFSAPVVGFLSAGQQAQVRNRTIDASGLQWYQVNTTMITGWLSASALEVSVSGTSCP